MFVLGTAGHIDHGKSVLVQALTGIDPDRLREEKERGMTIDLGFAWFTLPSGQEVGIVDVPGHEKFIKNMLAGVGGIDLALLIIAANEGVMPQTREHLAILDLLKVKKGIVVVTKKDLVDQEWLELVGMDVEELIATTGLSQAPVITVSALTGEGLPELVAAIDGILSSTEPRKDIGRPRLPIDRVFTMAGSGTVVTGTLIDGSLSTGDDVEIVPPGLKSRIRGLQTHKARLTTVAPGSRLAVNLVGITTSQIQRGDVVARPGWLVPATMASVRVRLLAYLKRPLRHNAMVSFHAGAAETMARVRLLEGEKLEPGETGWAQIVFSDPVAVVRNDYFIIRSTMETLGGGQVIDLNPRRLRRFRPHVIQDLKIKEEGSPEEMMMTVLASKQPLELAALLAECDLTEHEGQEVVQSLVGQNRVAGIGQGQNLLYYTLDGWERLIRETTGILQEYHRGFPSRPGISKAEVNSRLKLGKHSATIWPVFIARGIVTEEGAVVRLPGHQVKLTPAQQDRVADFMNSLAKNPYAPPGDRIPEPDLLNWLIEQGQVVKVSEDVVFSAAAYNEMVDKVTAHIGGQGKITLAEARDLFNTSRKYAQALLEYLDIKRITRRVGDQRILY